MQIIDIRIEKHYDSSEEVVEEFVVSTNTPLVDAIYCIISQLIYQVKTFANCVQQTNKPYLNQNQQ